MKLLKQIYRDQGLSLGGRTLERESAKAIIRRGQNLLLVYSSNGGVYKFPGGGVNPGETYEETLAREIKEECGVRLLEVVMEFGMIIEYKLPIEREYDVFKMISRYYLCKVGDGLGVLSLDDYERELGYHPQWVDIDVAVQANRLFASRVGTDTPDWIGRETYILRLVKQQVEG